MAGLSELIHILESQWDCLTILYAEPWSEPWTLQPGLRDDFEIYIVEKGKGTVTIDSRRYEVKEGDVFMLYSFDGNSFESEEGAIRMGLVTYSISGRPENSSVKSMMNDIIRSFEPVSCTDKAQAMLDILYKMNRQALLHQRGYMFRLKTMLIQMIMLLEEEIETDKSGANANCANASSRHSVDIIARYLYENAGNQITLADISKEVNLNERYICSLYRRYTGKTIMQHLQEIRIKRAQRLLTHTTLTITQIAQESGFYSSQYFARIFKRTTGFTPKHFRTYKSN